MILKLYVPLENNRPIQLKLNKLTNNIIKKSYKQITLMDLELEITNI